MSDLCRQEIQKAIRHAAESGETLFVATTASAIASRCGASAKDVAAQLTEAGIKAGATMQFGSPD